MTIASSPDPRRRLRETLASRRAPVIAAVVAALLAAPSIPTGLQLDDLLQQCVLRRVPPYDQWIRSPWRLFDFFDGDPAHVAWLRDLGALPWFSDPRLKLSFFRPLSALDLRLDHALALPAWAMHVHSVLWYALLAFVAALLYRQLFAREARAAWAAGLASILYAIDDAHAVPASWIANRNALIAGTFGLLTLLLHDRAQSTRRVPPSADSRSRAARVLAPVTCALALAAGEAGVATFAWLASHVLFLDPAPLRRKVVRLWPYAVVFALWLVAYRHSGAGTHGSALYTNPLQSPGRFVVAAAERFPILVETAFALPGADVAPFLPRAANVALIVVSLAVLAIVVAVVLRLWNDRLVRFFACGAALSLVPACSTVPSSRLLGFAGLGVFGLVACAAESASAGRLVRWFVRASLVMHAVVAPFAFLVGTQQFAITWALHRRLLREVPTDASIASRDVVVLTAPEIGGVPYLAVRRRLEGTPAPRRTWTLAAGRDPVTVQRIDDHTLLLRPERGFLDDVLTWLVRDPRDRFTTGEQIAIGGDERTPPRLLVTVTALTPDGRPAAATFEFDRSLDDPAWCFLAWDDDRLRVISPPRVGDTMVLRAGRLL